MRHSLTARMGAALVPLALAGTCLAAAPVAALAATPAALAASAAHDGAATAAASSRADSAASAAARSAATDKLADAGVFRDGALSFAGVTLSLPARMDVLATGTLASATSPDGNLTAAVVNLGDAQLPDGTDDAALAEAFKAAAGTAASGYTVASAQDAGTRELAGGATAWLYDITASGPYEVTENPDGTTSTSQVGPEGHWSFTQAYVKLPSGGLALVQVGTSDNATDDERAAASAAVESLALADAAAGAELPMGFTFDVPAGLSGSAGEGLWLGTSDDVMVESLGTLVPASDAAKLGDTGVRQVFEATAEEMGGTLEGVQARQAKNATVQVGVIAVDTGSLGAFECLLVLVPVSDGSLEGLLVQADAQAATTWADRLVQMVESIEVTPGEEPAPAAPAAPAAPGSAGADAKASAR